MSLLSAEPSVPISGRMEPRMLLVDDHPLTRDGLAALLAGNGFEIVGEAGSGLEAIDRARELQPDVILLDLSMPDLDGLSALPLLRTAAPDCEVVVLTASGDEENLLAAIRGGAARGLEVVLLEEDHRGTVKMETGVYLWDHLHRGLVEGLLRKRGVSPRREA